MVQGNRDKNFTGDVFFYNVGLNERKHFFEEIYMNITKKTS